jgi:hypothetical protein
VGGAARARSYGGEDNVSKHRGVQGGIPPCARYISAICTGVHTMAFEFFKVPVHAPGAFADDALSRAAHHNPKRQRGPRIVTRRASC